MIFPEPKPEAFYRPFANGYQVLHNKNIPGPLQITGTLKKSSYLVTRSKSDVLELELVGDAEIIPSKSALFNHMDNYVEFNVKHGSGYFDVTNAETGVAKHHFTASNKSVSSFKKRLHKLS